MSNNFNQNKMDGKDKWLTPPEIINAFPQFDLDPCAPINRPWSTAKKHYTTLDNGLAQEWHGCVWMNPPYGKECHKWLKKLSEHGSGIALIFARTETEMFKRYIWEKANALLFMYGRIFFHHVEGEKAKHNSGAPSVFIAYGSEASKRLKEAKIPGMFIVLTKENKGT